MDVRIRDYAAADFETLWRIDQACFEPGISYSRKELAWYMKLRGAFTLVGEMRVGSEWQPAGFMVAQQAKAELGHIVTIDVVAEARRSGLGRKMMEIAEARLRAAGCTAIFLETAVNNAAAIHFYKRLGYFVVKTIPRYYKDELDALLMGKKFETKHSRSKAQGAPLDPEC